MPTQGRGVRLDTIRVHAVDGVIGDFAGVEIMAIAVRTIHLIPMALPAGGLIGGEGHAGGFAHGAAATQQHKPVVVHAGQRFTVHGSRRFIFCFCF